MASVENQTSTTNLPPPGAELHPKGESLKGSLDPRVPADVGHRMAAEVFTEQIASAKSKTDTDADGAEVGTAVLGGMAIGAAFEHPKYAAAALALGLTIDLGRRVWSAATNPENKGISSAFSASELKGTAELGLAAIAGYGLGRLGREGLATKLERLPGAFEMPVTESAARVASDASPLIRRDFSISLSPERQPSMTTRAVYISEPDKPSETPGAYIPEEKVLSPWEQHAKQAGIMKEVFKQKDPNAKTIAIPLFRGDEMHPEASVIISDRDFGLGKFYLDVRRPTAQVHTTWVDKAQRKISPGSGSSFFIEGEPGQSVFGVSNKHVLGGSHLTIIQSSDHQVFLPQVLAVDHDADIVLYKPVQLPAEVLKHYPVKDATSGDPAKLPFFPLASSGEMSPGSFVGSVNHVASMEQDVLSMGQSKGNLLTKSDKNNSEGRVIGRVMTNASSAGGGSGGPYFNETGEITGVLSLAIGRGTIGTRVEHVRALRDIVLHSPPPAGQHWKVDTTFDAATGIVRVARLELSSDPLLGGRVMQADFRLIHDSPSTAEYADEQSKLGEEIVRNRERMQTGK